MLILPLWLLACGGATLSTDSDPAVSTTPPGDSATTPDATETVGGLGPTFSHGRGVYDASFTLDIWGSEPGAEVRVSTDGRSALDGEPWAGPVTIATTTPVAAVVLLDGVPVTDAVTHTFLFLDHVADQAAPASWPTTWWGDYTADYGMDPELADAGLVPSLAQRGVP